MSDAFGLPRRLFSPFFCSRRSSRGSQFRDEHVARSSGGPSSDIAAFVAPRVDRLVRSSVKRGSIVVVSELGEEAEPLVSDQHGKGLVSG